MSSEVRAFLSGCGKLGFRYAQGLLNSERPLYLLLTDEYLSASELRSQSGPIGHFYSLQHKTEARSRIGVIKKGWRGDVDWAIFSGRANLRRKMVESFLEHSKSRNTILEKIVCNDPADLINLDSLLGNCAKVNLPRFQQSLYHALRGWLNQSGLTVQEIDVSLAGRGLICNALHFLTLPLFFRIPTGGNLKCDISKWFPAKRIDCVEAFGRFELSSSSCKVVVSDYGRNRLENLILMRLSDGSLIKVSEAESAVYREGGVLLRGDPIKTQSELTRFMVEDESIYAKLPWLMDIVPLHHQFCLLIQAEWERDGNLGKVPVT